ncbi:Mobile element protein [Candidatus Enterovibrio altilux]|uniref:Mobile element protein n=1 Tax=Candidatus Enterovibrio altilux TaxID=1927128 RepID=A0A291B8W6_9GAMM|nr:Mobile element protein [Candidatus Enterovibrio luxaltus]
MHEIIAAELSASNVTGGVVLPHLLKQIHRRINSTSGHSAYDTIRVKRSVPLVPQKEE